MSSFPNANKKKEPVLFRSLEYHHLPFALWYLWRGYTVYYLTIRPGIEKIFLTAGFFHSKLVKHASWGDFNFYSQAFLNNMVLDDIEEIYSKILKNEPCIEELEHFLQSPLVHGIYKKVIALEMFEHCRLFSTADALKKENHAEHPLLVPAITLKNWNSTASLCQKLLKIPPVRVPLWALAICTLEYHFSRLKWLLFYGFFPFWLLLHLGIPASRPITARHYQLGIRVYRTDVGFNYRYRSIDFLVDGKEINAQNTVFCLETDISAEYREKLMEKGYHVVDMRSILTRVSMDFINKTICGDIFPIWKRLFSKLVHQPPLVIHMTMEILYKYAVWMAFFEQYRVKHYLVYNDNTPGSVLRNMIINRHEGTTWYYVHSVHTYEVFTPENRPPLREILISFLSYDHIAVWGKKIEKYFQSCPNDVKNYQRIGCLWSEHAVQAAETRNANEVVSHAITGFARKKVPIPQKLIGVFDTSVGETAPLQTGDMIEFLHGFMRLLDDFPEIGILLKNKNPLSYISVNHPELIPYYQNLMDHPRCIFMGDLNPDPADTIAASDLSVSACFTSTTVEALGAKKRAIYYDASGRFSGTYYDNFPHLVAHSYDELRELVHHWLYETSDQEFTFYLQTYVLGELDAFLDGGAITRLRKLLSG